MPNSAAKRTSHYLKLLSEAIERAADAPGVDPVHDLRVAVRRASQALRIFEDQLPKGAARKVRRRINSIRDQAAPVRDRDVIHALLLSRRLPATDPACIYLRGQRDLAAQQLQAYLAELLRQGRPKQWISRIGEEP